MSRNAVHPHLHATIFFIRLLSLFQKVGARISMSVVGPIAVLFAFFLYSGFRAPFSPVPCFVIVFEIILFHYDVSLMIQRTPVCNLELHQN